jgi:hypothetical protein
MKSARIPAGFVCFVVGLFWSFFMKMTDFPIYIYIYEKTNYRFKRKTVFFKRKKMGNTDSRKIGTKPAGMRAEKEKETPPL